MKIWNGYGSEHSMNLVMIGHFKSEEDAKETQRLIDDLSAELSGKIDVGSCDGHFSEEVSNILRRLNCYCLSPNDLEHFLCLCTFDLMLWEKELCNTIFSFSTNIKALFLTGFFEKFM